MGAEDRKERPHGGELEIRHLRYFLAVAEELHFGRAAQRLGLAQPPLSQQIQQLERILGAKVFDRSQRPIRLTDVGQALADEARHVLAHAAHAEQVARYAESGDYGRLEVGFTSAAAYQILPSVLSQYRHQHPHVRLVLQELTTRQQVDALSEGRLDVGLLRPPIGADELACEPIFEEPYVAVLPATHQLAHASSVALAELAKEPFILIPRSAAPGTYDHIIHACLSSGFSPRVVQEAVDHAARIGLVAAGIGISLVPARYSIFQVSGAVTSPLRDRIKVGIAISWRKPATPTIEDFLAMVRQVASVQRWLPRLYEPRPL